MTVPLPEQPHSHQHKIGAMEFAVLSELRRRNVFRVASAYLGTAWFLVHMSTVLAESFTMLHRVMPLVIGVIGAGLPVAMSTAWLFELTPEGFKLTRHVERHRSNRALTARRLDTVIAVLFALAVGVMVTDRWFLHRPADESVIPLFSLVLLALLADRLIGRRDASFPESSLAHEQDIAQGSKASIAVLPFVDLSEKKDQEYFTDGLSEELISLLTKVSHVRVLARTSCFYFKGRQATAGEIAKCLNVAHLLEGSVRRSGDRVRISTRLVRADDGCDMWAETFDRKLDDIFQVQDDIARAVVLALKERLLPGAQTARTLPYGTGAYQLYLQARFHWNKRTPSDFLQAIEFLKRAIAAAPDYALAYAGIADCYSLLPLYDRKLDPMETAQPAKAAAAKALALGGNLAEAHASMALTLTLFDYDWKTAETHYRRALEIDASAPTPHQWYGEMLVNSRRFEEGLGHSRLALSTDPLSPVANLALGIALNSARQYDEAIRYLQRTLDLRPGFADTSEFLADAYANKGMYAEAVDVYVNQQRLSGTPPERIDAAREAFAGAGWQGFLQNRIGLLETGPDPVPERIAALYARLGDKDRALAWLEKAVQRRGARLPHINVDAAYDSLRDDPRFTDILRRIGLAS